MANCIFCRIARGEMAATVVERDGGALAIEDLHPQAPVHLLVMPAEHYASIDEMLQRDAQVATDVLRLAASLGRRRSGDAGFRLVVNTGAQGGQTVDHVHVHVLAGRPLSWPPG
ncbi:MAG: HIT domain-containing protein [Candidatus Eremiobacteraeota bacterium]|nr:HIT domain-containing protein [Candidatus Eremiobacteraeota bacterium]